MNVACISASRVPSTAANSMQVMKACQAISQLGHEVHLFLPRRVAAVERSQEPGQPPAERRRLDQDILACAAGLEARGHQCAPHRLQGTDRLLVCHLTLSLAGMTSVS